MGVPGPYTGERSSGRNMKIAVTGATGYIGGRLVPQLLDAGHDVVCLVRNPAKLADDPWRDRVEVRRADVLEKETLDAGLEGCDAAYYLVHSMGGGDGFEDKDQKAAANFAAAAESNGLDRIIYLGGMGQEGDLSPHLRSRHETGKMLASGTTPVTELRAAVVIGSGSISFEMLRYLTEVLPVMTTPRWVETKLQPIAIGDVLKYLVAALGDEPGDHIYEIGGPDIVSYRDLMHLYADVAGLPRRLIIGVPVLSPGLSSRWIGLVTPLDTKVARPLVDSLRNEVVVTDHPPPAHWDITTTPLRTSMEQALQRQNEADVTTRWTDASSSPALAFRSDPEWSGGTLFTDHKVIETSASRSALFSAFTRVGGETGYYVHDWAWRLRGFLDSLVGGVGLRRGRRHPTQVALHETIDFWRVADVRNDELLQLAAEMKLPGDAWLEWRIEGDDGSSTLHQTAYFRPRGLFGRLYWYAMLPFHHFIFEAMARRIAEHAEQLDEPAVA